MYQVRYLEAVIKKDIPKLPKKEKERIQRFIEDRLIKNPMHFSQPLKYSFQNCRRMRIGGYRIIFKILKEDILIVKIGYRKDIYKFHLK